MTEEIDGIPNPASSETFTESHDLEAFDRWATHQDDPAAFDALMTALGPAPRAGRPSGGAGRAGGRPAGDPRESTDEATRPCGGAASPQHRHLEDHDPAAGCGCEPCKTARIVTARGRRR